MRPPLFADIPEPPYRAAIQVGSEMQKFPRDAVVDLCGREIANLKADLARARPDAGEQDLDAMALQLAILTLSATDEAGLMRVFVELPPDAAELPLNDLAHEMPATWVDRWRFLSAWRRHALAADPSRETLIFRICASIAYLREMLDKRDMPKWAQGDPGGRA